MEAVTEWNAVHSRRMKITLDPIRIYTESIFPDGREHGEARFFIDMLHLLYQALIYQRSHALEDVQS